jgi:hypothetical protein
MLYVMLVGGYPFERPEDKNDNMKLQKMIEVIHRQQMSLPAPFLLADAHSLKHLALLFPGRSAGKVPCTGVQ